ncbi:MAG: HPr family phosphocarrier protein [Pseudomonadota bacterium]
MAVVVRNVVVSDPRGLHMRPSSAIAEAARGAEGSTITLHYMGRSASATSVLSLMMLAATQGAEIEITAEGERPCQPTVERICQILRTTQVGSHE